MGTKGALKTGGANGTSVGVFGALKGVALMTACNMGAYGAMSEDDRVVPTRPKYIRKLSMTTAP